MSNNRRGEALILGAFLCVGLVVAGYFLSSSVFRLKALDRTVTVKGLAEREVPADIAIWPISFSVADNDLSNLVSMVERNNALVTEFLKNNGFTKNEISISAPAILDRQAQQYADSSKGLYRYLATSIVTVYTTKVEAVRNTMNQLVDLGKQGVAIAGKDYKTKTEFLFTRLNDLKPAMIEEATNKAREVAVKFAQDSKSKLGKIKRARQGQFSIKNRDSNTPYIKKIRVVSTLEYYLSD